LCFSLPAWSAAVQATLDRDRVQLGDIVTLNVRLQGVGTPQPIDLGPLAPDFDVLNSSTNASLTFINGHPAAELTIGLVLRPTHTGELTIPVLSVAGQATAPIQLQVDQADPAAAAADSRKNVYMEAAVEPAKGYVGQQLQYVLRLYYATSLSAGGLDDPQADGASFQRLGNDLTYETNQGGRPYHVIERRYALMPQRAGKLVIPPVQFQGETVDMNDPDSFFPNTQPVGASTPAVTVEVQGIPDHADKQTWLPVHDLKLTAEGLPDGDVHVGQPLNLTMLLQATGAPYESLPNLSLPPIDGANVYPDKPLNGTRSDGTSLLARRQQGFAIIPSRPGTLVIPEITVHWWNVDTGQPEVARLPERRFTVLPAAGQPAAAASAASAASVAPDAVQTPAPAPTAGLPWRWIALASLGLWLLSMAIWWWRRRRLAAAPVDPANAALASTRQLKAAFMATAQGGDATKQAQALLAWAKAERPSLQNLGDLSNALGAQAQRDAIAAIERHRYAADGAGPALTGLATCFRAGFAWKTDTPRQASSGLPSLYPFDVRAGDRD
jgi:hypothetical protein